MLSVWFVPTRSGDYRLTRVSDAKSLLTVEDPTPLEVAHLRTFLVTLRDYERPVVDPLVGIALTGKSTVEIDLPLPLVARLLVSDVKADTWTAVRSEGGKIELLTTPVESAAEVVATKPTAQAAVSFAPPARGCPAPLRCNYRASEVLRTFSTRSQWGSWVRSGYMRVRGNLSQHPYTILHRDLAARQGRGHSVIDHRGVEVCVWDESVPAEEEALAIKLTLEHHEGYVLTRHGDRAADVL